MATPTELEKLIRKRGSIKSKITIFSKFLDNLEFKYPDNIISDSILVNQLEERTERFRNVFGDFDLIQNEIDILSDDKDKQLDERELFENEFYATSARANALLNANVVAPSGSDGGSAHSVRSITSDRAGFECNVKLPVIQLPKFDGNYNNWLEFRDSFDSLINKNDAISEIQKFHYLRASLTNGALEIIASLEFSGTNYAIAWALLGKRYNNSRILVQNHVKALFSLDKIAEESSQPLRKITDNVTKHLRALKILKEPTEHWDTLIIHLVTQKLDSITAREWEQKKASYDKPTLENLQNFLKDRADLLESLENNKQKKIFKQKFENKTHSTTKSFASSQRAICSFCKKGHYTQECPDLQKLSVNERLIEIKKLRLCFNCLRSGHSIKECRSISCKNCKGRHHTLLHLDATEKVQASQEDESKEVRTVCSARNVQNPNTQVLLSTVLIKVYKNNNETRMARALLDAGSQSSFITCRLAEELNLDLSDIEIKVCGLNQTESKVKHKTSLYVQSRCNSFSRQVSCLVVPQITGTLPNFPIYKSTLGIPNNITLADPNFHVPDQVDLLLGADHFWHIMCVGQIKLSNQNAVLQKSKFGWIIAGAIPSQNRQTIQCNLLVDIDRQLKRFWEVEEVFTSKPLSREEQLCESHFSNTTKRNESGQFIATIPLKENPNVLGDSYENAKKRLLSLERKFKGNSSFKAEYTKFINEYISLGHMSKVTQTDNSEISYYLPHHGVLKESSLTTKLRVVFDASCPTTTGYSLNDIQMIGPTIQPDLFSALIRFRTYNYVIVGDVEKMYRMCLINPSQRSLQRILWRESPEHPIETYELATVTYGTSSAAFLAIRCLYQIGIECSQNSPLISHIIKNHFYVDDLLSGAKTVNEAISIADGVARTLKNYGFKLRKWISNSPEVLDSISTQDKINALDFGTHEHTKTLGLIWYAHHDYLGYSINITCSKKITKRTILSESSQIFDPLGILSPSTILAKILLQDLWLEKLDWDESLPIYLHTRWLHFRDELSSFNDLKIKRQVTCKDTDRVEMHGFSDASIKAFGACVYMKSHNLDGTCKVEVVCAKSKVAPLKSQTVPRLELMAALLLAQLMDKVINSLEEPVTDITYWCDSTVVLGWLKTASNLLPLVANRVARVQELCNIANWHHVPTSDNPADHVSRGVMPTSLCNLDIYWNGPKWLSQDESFWPTLNYADTELPDLRKSAYIHFTSNLSYSSFEKYSDLSKIERIVAYCFRFKNNCLKDKPHRTLGPLRNQEIKIASLHLAKLSQAECFSNELESFRKGATVTKGQFARLSPFLDDNQIIRVGGRLKNSDFSFAKKHPILLSSKHTFTKLLFKREHARLLHAGPQQLLFSIREQYWPLSGRSLARQTVHQCIQCFKAKPRLTTPIMGNLPRNRLSPAPPFYTTGVDYCGPFVVKDRKGRGYKATKAYVSLFICFITRAIHLELVSDLTKDAFIAALRRFIARRRKPSQIYSDNGTNFVGASSELRSLGEFLKQYSDDLTHAIENQGIAWSFIPAHSPHFGGLWEAGVKSTKHHLRRVAGTASLTFEQFITLLVQIESVLNSRPMTPLSADPTDLSPLTPAHFLIGRPLTTAADPDLTTLPINRLDYFQQVQRLQQHFWSRWSVEYISELQQRQKWLRSSERKLEINDLVLIKEDNQPPLKWCLGRIIELHPGSDGIARVATMKTSHGTIKRSFSKLCPLPL